MLRVGKPRGFGEEELDVAVGAGAGWRSRGDVGGAGEGGGRGGGEGFVGGAGGGVGEG